MRRPIEACCRGRRVIGALAGDEGKVRTLTDEQIGKTGSFLESLTGKLPAGFAGAPLLLTAGFQDSSKP